MDNKAMVFADFARRAAERIEERKKLKTVKVHIPALEGDITLRGLTDQEWIDIRESVENEYDQDKYAVFYASEDLQETAKIMVDMKMLKETEQFRICEAFNHAEITFMVKKIMELSGLMEKSEIKVVDEVEETKNLSGAPDSLELSDIG